MDFTSEIKSFLIENNISFNEIKPRLFKTDYPVFLIEKNELALHIISISKIKNNAPDLFSKLNDESEKKKIKLIHLWEDVWLQNKELVQSRILAVCGQSKRIHARQTEIVRLNKSDAELFLNENHLQKYTTTYFKYGLKLKNKLVAVATFSKSRIMTDSSALYRSYELVRYANLSGTTVTGGLSKLLKYFIEEIHPAHIMTYADRDWSSGESYLKLEFKLVEITPPQLFYIHPNELKRIYPNKTDSSEKDFLKKGYLKIYNSGNLKFILDRRNLHLNFNKNN